MTDKDLFIRRFRLMLGAYLLIPLSFILMTAADFEGHTAQRILAYLVGMMFWCGGIIGTVNLYSLNRIRKNDSRNTAAKKTPGIFSFFSCKQGRTADIILFSVILIYIVLSVTHLMRDNIRFISYSVLLLSVILHSVFNGKNYMYLNSIMKG